MKIEGTKRTKQSTLVQYFKLIPQNEEKPKLVEDQPSSLIQNSHQTSILARLNIFQIPKLSLPAYTPIRQASEIYYNQYLKLFSQNQKLNDELIETIKERDNFALIYDMIKKQSSDVEGTKRKRRYAKDIERLFYCPIKACMKGYGSEGSLSHHVRLKHPSIYKSQEYEIFIDNCARFVEKNQNVKEKIIQYSKNQKISSSKVQVENIDVQLGENKIGTQKNVIKIQNDQSN